MRNDRSWMYIARRLPEFENGVIEFLNVSFSKGVHGSQIRCPCKRCANRYWLRRHEVYDHLKGFGYVENYHVWTFHGEDPLSTEPIVETLDEEPIFNDNTDTLLEDRFRSCCEGPTNVQNGPNDEAKKFYKLVEEGQQELFPGCKNFSKLSFIIRLFLYKTLHGISNVAFNELLQLLRDMVPEAKIPVNYTEAKNIVKDLGLDYRKICACPNDCMLFWKEFENAEECFKCHASKWRKCEENSSNKTSNTKNSRQIPAKVLWHFPLPPRLQRVYMNSEIAEAMTWHADKRPKDGYLRHPADGSAWKDFDSLYPNFANDPRNVRLGLASDGFNPFRTMSVCHSTWPVVLVNYNLPPWMPGRTNHSNNKDADYVPSHDEEEDAEVNAEVRYQKVSQASKSGNQQRSKFIPSGSVTRYSNYTRLRNQSQAKKHEERFKLPQLFDKDQTGVRQDAYNDLNPTMADLILKRNQMQIEKDLSKDFHQSSHFTSDPEDSNIGSKAHESDIQPSPTEGDTMGVCYGNSSQLQRDELIVACFGEDLTDSSTEGENADSDEEEYPEDESEEINLDNQDLQQDAISEGGTRGPSMLPHVHNRSTKNKVAIILNEYGQPIGPVIPKKDIVGEFARFLGTLARDYTYVPLVFDSWRKVPDKEKEKLWEYVLTKYMVPEEGKDWVMKTIRDSWRVYKSRFKKKHLYAYKDDKSRWRHRSNLVPDDDFLKLLAKWKKKSEKRRCCRNRDRRLAQRNMHTAGPKSFARIREELKNGNPDHEPPTLSQLFEHTRARKPGNKYKDAYDDTERKITEMKTYVPDDGECLTDPFLGVMGKEYDGRRRLFGRGVSNKKLKEVNGTQTSYVVPADILDSLKTSLREDLRKDMDYELSRRNKEQDEQYLTRKAELESMEQNIENQRDLIRDQILTKFLERLPPEVVKEYLS